MKFRVFGLKSKVRGVLDLALLREYSQMIIFLKFFFLGGGGGWGGGGVWDSLGAGVSVNVFCFEL